MEYLPVIAVVLTSAYATTTLTVPWVQVFVSVNINTLYSVRVPLDIGLLQCFSEVCVDYTNFVKRFSGSQATGPDSSDSYGTLPFQHMAEERIHEDEAPFKHAGIAMMVSMAIAVVCGSYTLSLIAIDSFRSRNLVVDLREQSSVFWVISVVLFAGNALYCLLTFRYLNGGYYYFQGVYLMNTVSMLNAMVAVCCSYCDAQTRLQQTYTIIADEPSAPTSSLKISP